MVGFTVTSILCCVLALGGAAVVPGPAAVSPYHTDSAYSSDNSLDTHFPSDDIPAEPYHPDTPPDAFNHHDTTPELNEDKKFLGSHLLYVINNNMGSVAAATLGSLFGPFGAYVSAFTYPPISQALKHFSGGVISRENDEPLELLQ